MKFKVGDKVKAVKSIGAHNSDYKIGEVYTIIRVDEDCIAFPYQLNVFIWCKEEELELAEDDFDKKEEE